MSPHPCPPRITALSRPDCGRSASSWSSAQRSAIDGHVRLLLAWNQSINLTAIRDPEAVAIGHVVDSLSALPVMRERGLRRFVDLGSGGGFPGLPVAAALDGRRGAARRLRREEGPLPRRRRGGGRDGGNRRDVHRSGGAPRGRPRAPPALAGRPGASSRGPARARRAVVPAAGSVAACSSPGSEVMSPPKQPPRRVP